MRTVSYFEGYFQRYIAPFNHDPMSRLALSIIYFLKKMKVESFYPDRPVITPDQVTDHQLELGVLFNAVAETKDSSIKALLLVNTTMSYQESLVYCVMKLAEPTFSPYNVPDPQLTASVLSDEAWDIVKLIGSNFGMKALPSREFTIETGKVWFDPWSNSADAQRVAKKFVINVIDGSMGVKASIGGFGSLGVDILYSKDVPHEATKREAICRAAQQYILRNQSIDLPEESS